MTTTTDRRHDLECPECHKKGFTPQGLGAHRSKLHGVAGSSRSTVNLLKLMREKKRAEQKKTKPANPPAASAVKHEANGARDTGIKPADVCYCPKCGTNIHVVAMSLAFAERNGK